LTRKTTAALPAAIAFLVPFALYVYCAAWGPDGWDYGEAQTVPWILGIFHPTGFPLYTLVGWLFAHVLAISTVAWRMNVLSSLSIAAACAAVYALARGFGAARVAAVPAAFVFAVTIAAWTNAIHAEVHALLLAAIAATLVALQRALLRRSLRWFIATMALFGCALAIHPNALWLFPGIVIGALVLRRTFDLRGAILALVAALAPLVTYAYLPLRAWTIHAWNLDPNAAPPLDGAGGSVWGAIPVDTWTGFHTEISGSQFDASGYASLALDPSNWLTYAIDWLTRAQTELTALVAVLAVVGLYALIVRRDVTLPVVVAGAGSVPFAFAYGPISIDTGRYLLPSFVVAAALAPAAVTVLRTGWRRSLASLVVGVAFLGVAWTLFQAHQGNLTYHGSPGDQSSIDTVVAHTPDGALVLCNWLTATTLEYGKEVEGALGSRIVVLSWPLEDTQGTIRHWAQSRRVFADADFVLKPELPQRLPLTWLHVIGDWNGHEIVEILPR
jgi:hypothetical protein